MDHIVITGARPYDGRYELNLDAEFTTREWGWIKRLSGYLPLTLDAEAFSDPELACVLAVIMLRRSGRITNAEVPEVFDKLIDQPFGTTVTIEATAEDEAAAGDAGPPARRSNGNAAASGASSPTNSGTSEPPTPPGSGSPRSATSPSAPTTSGS